MPKRIQRQRTKGWRMPPGAVYVGRPTKWGNPFPVGSCVCGGVVQEGDEDRPEMILTSARSVEHYTMWLPFQIIDGILDPRELAGKDLACWCPLDKPCHADVLLALANRGLTED